MNPPQSVSRRLLRTLREGSSRWVAFGIGAGLASGLVAVVFFLALEAATHLTFGILAGSPPPQPPGEQLFEFPGAVAAQPRPWLRLDDHAPVGIEARELLTQPLAHGRHLGLCGRKSRAVREAPDHDQPASSRLPPGLADRQGPPEVSGLAQRVEQGTHVELEVGGHDADDLVGAAVDLEGLADDVASPTEALLPEVVTENHYRLSAWGGVLRK